MDNSNRLYNSECTDQDILRYFGIEKATYADLLDRLSEKGIYCSVKPVETYSTRSGIAYYPVLDRIDGKTVKKSEFVFMRTFWGTAMEEAIKKAIEISKELS